MLYGDPRLPERFWDKVIPVPFSGCYLWTGAVTKKGYPKFWYKGKSRKAHRLVKKFKRTADHKCRVTCCVNADHLRDMTRSKNTRLGNEARSG